MGFMRARETVSRGILNEGTMLIPGRSQNVRMS